VRHISATHDVTGLLVQWANGSKEALDDLNVGLQGTPSACSQPIAKRKQEPHATANCASYEAYLRLVDQKNPNWQNRSHFFGVPARLMRQILVDHARGKQAGKRAALKVSLK
jgi:ECF sigma factor